MSDFPKGNPCPIFFLKKGVNGYYLAQHIFQTRKSTFSRGNPWPNFLLFPNTLNLLAFYGPLESFKKIELSGAKLAMSTLSESLRTPIFQLIMTSFGI